MLPNSGSAKNTAMDGAPFAGTALGIWPLSAGNTGVLLRLGFTCWPVIRHRPDSPYGSIIGNGFTGRYNPLQRLAQSFSAFVQASLPASREWPRKYQRPSP